MLTNTTQLEQIVKSRQTITPQQYKNCTTFLVLKILGSNQKNWNLFLHPYLICPLLLAVAYRYHPRVQSVHMKALTKMLFWGHTQDARGGAEHLDLCCFLFMDLPLELQLRVRVYFFFQTAMHYHY